MAEKTNGKSLNYIIIVVGIIAVLLVGFIIFKVVKNNNSWREAKNEESIVIKDKDSKEVKIEKLQKKIELINEDIEDIQVKINPELDKMNQLYEEYVGVMNEFQPVAPAVDESTPETSEE